MTAILEGPGGVAPCLRVEGMTVSFGGVQAVNNLTLAVPAGQVLSVIGPNGAGKTTVLNAISGFVRCSGSIFFKGIDLAKEPAWRRAELGIGRTFQNLQLFGSLSVLENVVIGAHTRQRVGIPASMLHWGWARNEDNRARQAAKELLEQVGLAADMSKPADSLPLASQKLLSIARALAPSPRLLLLDEPAAGMVGEAMEELSRLILNLSRDRGLSVMLVEHHMGLVMTVSDSIAVMNQGQLLAQGDPASIQEHPEVISAYLGTGQTDEQDPVVRFS